MNAHEAPDYDAALITSSFDSATTTFVDVTGSTVTVTAAVGDILVIDASLRLCLAVGSNVSWARLLVNDGGTNYNPGPLASSSVSAATGNVSAADMSCVYVVTTAGTVTVKAQLRAGASTTARVEGATANNGTSSTNASSVVRVLQYRP